MIEIVAILLALVLNLAIGIGLHSLPHEATRTSGAVAGLLVIALVGSAFVYSVTSGFLLLAIVVLSGGLLAPLGRILAARLRGFDVSAEHAKDYDRTQAMMNQLHKDRAATNDLLRDMFPDDSQSKQHKKGK